MKTPVEIKKEIEKLTQQLAKEKKPDPIDVAVLAALSSRKVIKELGEILNSGATYTGITGESAGTIHGIIQLTFNTKWNDGISQKKPADVVSVLIEVNPPKIISVVKSQPTTIPTASYYLRLEGDAPSILKGITYPNFEEAIEFDRKAKEEIVHWMMQRKWPPIIYQGSGGGLTSGTHCTSAMCFEKSSDDFD
jgi:hypothetical protein